MGLSSYFRPELILPERSSDEVSLGSIPEYLRREDGIHQERDKRIPETDIPADHAVEVSRPRLRAERRRLEMPSRPADIYSPVISGRDSTGGSPWPPSQIQNTRFPELPRNIRTFDPSATRTRWSGPRFNRALESFSEEDEEDEPQPEVPPEVSRFSKYTTDDEGESDGGNQSFFTGSMGNELGLADRLRGKRSSAQRVNGSGLASVATPQDSAPPVRSSARLSHRTSLSESIRLSRRASQVRRALQRYVLPPPPAEPPRKTMLSEPAKSYQRSSNPFSLVESPAYRRRTRAVQSGPLTSKFSNRASAADSLVLSDLRCKVMVSHLHKLQKERLWWRLGSENEGVVLKKAKGEYVCCPDDLDLYNHGLFDAVKALNVRVAITINTTVIQLYLKQHDKRQYVPLDNGLRLQIVPTLASLPRCQKHHFAAFIADKSCLVVWDDDPLHILDRGAEIEHELLNTVWASGSSSELPAETGEQDVDAGNEVPTNHNADPERGETDDQRRIVLWQPFLVGFTMLLTFAAMGVAWRRVALEIQVDGRWIRLAFLACVPAQIWLGVFFFQAVLGCVLQLFGPVSQLQQNSRYYSGVRPTRISRNRPGGLPHVTIQMPIYKEGLSAVIEKTIISLKAAISTYEMQGGTANIFINDDGLQLIDEYLQKERIEAYSDHDIGWVARPPHNPKPNEGDKAFWRRGLFKKASNLNYALWISNRIEDKLKSTIRHDDWTEGEENEIYSQALSQVREEEDNVFLAAGNVRVGDYILLVDSDTRVPRDCLLDAVSEMEQSPEVAIIQYASGVLNVTTSFFEKGITFFTNLIYDQIRLAVANGDTAPFVGHNAILRWSAVQQVAYECPLDHREKHWSEKTVSEDFDMALRLQGLGYTVRFAAYTGKGFEEGVSLTVYDELARWEKYAYGCAELVFHPVRHWFFGGPFTPLFRSFVTGKIPLTSKITILGYIGTYYAIASAWILTLANYFVLGWFNSWQDHFYVDSFRIYIGVLVVFSGVGNLSYAVLRYRIGHKALLNAMLENFRWVPMFFIFLGGVSMHVSQAIVSHLCSVRMQWGSTAKEVENTTFFNEIPKVLRKFKFTFAFCIGCAAMMIFLSQGLPEAWHWWRIRLFVAIYPLGSIIASHFFLPIALNPSLMLFSW